MVKSSTVNSTSRVESLIEQLFEHPPVNEAELARRLKLKTVELESARRLLVDRLERGELEPGELELFGAALHHLGAGKEKTRLIGFFENRRHSDRARSAAFAVLLSEDPALAARISREVSEEEAMRLAEQPLVELLSHVQVDPDRASLLTELFEQAPEEVRGDLLERLEHHRVQSGVPAAVLYEHLLGATRMSGLRPAILERVSAEAAPGALPLFQRLRDRATADDARLDFQKALMRLTTRLVNGRVAPRVAKGFAHLGTCDGQGAFIVVGCFENPSGSFSVADLVIRAAADVRDGFVLPHQSRDDIDELLATMKASAPLRFTEVSLEQAVAFVVAAIDRSAALGSEIPVDGRAAVTLFEQVRPASLEGSPTGSAGPFPTVDELRSLLTRPEYESWFFDAGDLTGVDVPPPPNGKKKRDKWLARARAGVGSSTQMKTRVVEMARHMFRWYSLSGDDELASLCSRAALAAEQSFGSSTLLRAMLEATLATLTRGRGPIGPSAWGYGDPNARRVLKLAFFDDIKHPRGRDLARLDFTEAAVEPVHRALDFLPGERRPREDRRVATAHAIGSAFADYVIARGKMTPDQLGARAMRDVMRVTDLTAEEAMSVAVMVLNALSTFAGEVCAHCRVGCIETPDRGFADAFFSVEHPAGGRDPAIVLAGAGRRRR